MRPGDDLWLPGVAQSGDSPGNQRDSFGVGARRCESSAHASSREQFALRAQSFASQSGGSARIIRHFSSSTPYSFAGFVAREAAGALGAAFGFSDFSDDEGLKFLPIRIDIPDGIFSPE